MFNRRLVFIAHDLIPVFLILGCTSFAKEQANGGLPLRAEQSGARQLQVVLGGTSK